MTPTQIAQNIVKSASARTRSPQQFQDEVAREIARAISSERTLLSKYLEFLNQRIARQPELVRHNLLRGSSRLLSGLFLEEMPTEERTSFMIRLNRLSHGHYSSVEAATTS